LLHRLVGTLDVRESAERIPSRIGGNARRTSTLASVEVDTTRRAKALAIFGTEHKSWHR